MTVTTVPATTWRLQTGKGDYIPSGQNDIGDPLGNNLVDPSSNQIVDTAMTLNLTPDTVWDSNEAS